MRRLLALGLLALALVPGVSGEAARTKPLLGVFGDPARFQQLTGERSSVRHVILGWNQGLTWGKPLGQFLPTLTPVPMLGVGAKKGWPNPARRSPRSGSPRERATPISSR